MVSSRRSQFRKYWRFLKRTFALKALSLVHRPSAGSMKWLNNYWLLSALSFIWCNVHINIIILHWHTYTCASTIQWCAAPLDSALAFFCTVDHGTFIRRAVPFVCIFWEVLGTVQIYSACCITSKGSSLHGAGQEFVIAFNRKSFSKWFLCTLYFWGTRSNSCEV